MNTSEILQLGELKALKLAAKESYDLKCGIWVYTSWLDNYLYLTSFTEHKPLEHLTKGYRYKFHVDFSMYEILNVDDMELPSFKVGEIVEVFGGSKYHKDTIKDVTISQAKDSDREYLTENFGRLPVNQIRKLND